MLPDATLARIDIVLIALYFAASIVIALLLRRRAGGSTEEFFLSGRKLPWWLAGTAMVATTFAADTPLAVTEMVAKNGISGNWLWWNMVAGSVLTVFFFAKLWRRASILTDVEFIEIRYSGRPAAFLRGFKAVYLGVFMNVIIMGWVNLALASVLTVIFGVDGDRVFWYIIGAMAVVALYSAISGLWGVALTDMFQFVIAMAGCVLLAVEVLDLPQIGGTAGLMEKLPGELFRFFPSIGGASDAATGVLSISATAFVAHIAIQWWSSWYPGNEPGGGGYVAQRMMSAKNERHSLMATLWFAVAHYALRPWPWIVVALATLLLYPGIEHPREGYLYAIRDHLPPGLRGFLIAAFLAAYMSTIATHLNWGSSYLINDLYRRFVRKNAGESHYVLVSRGATIFLMIISSLMIKVMSSITGAWEFIIECGAGLGLVLILRWYWWRLNAWSELTAMIVPIVVYGAAKGAAILGFDLPFMNFPESLFFIAGITTVSWVAMTFLTSPVERERLESFYRLVRPGGPGWRGFNVASASSSDAPEPLTGPLVDWVLGMGVVYGALFGIGKLVFHDYIHGFSLCTFAAVLFIILALRLRKEKK